MPFKDTEQFLSELSEKVNDSDEVEFLKYLIDCCENVLESENIVSEVMFHPVMMQLVKLRAEVTQRLEVRFGIKYGKFANGNHLLSRKK